MVGGGVRGGGNAGGGEAGVAVEWWGGMAVGHGNPAAQRPYKQRAARKSRRALQRSGRRFGNVARNRQRQGSGGGRW